MFCLNDSMRYFLCPGYTDMRKGLFTLSGLVHERMGGDIRSGNVFIFYISNNIMLAIQCIYLT